MWTQIQRYRLSLSQRYSCCFYIHSLLLLLGNEDGMYAPHPPPPSLLSFITHFLRASPEARANAWGGTAECFTAEKVFWDRACVWMCVCVCFVYWSGAFVMGGKTPVALFSVQVSKQEVFVLDILLLWYWLISTFKCLNNFDKFK